MSGAGALESFSLSVPAARQIDAVCDRMEEAFQAGQPPRLEDLLDSVEDPLRPALLRQILLLEWEYLQQRTGRLDLSDYLARFPQYESLIHQTFAEFSSEAESAPGTLPENASSAAGESTPGGSRTPHLPVQEWNAVGYIVLSQLGRGGMGTVYLARQTAADRLVALKLLQDDMQDDPAALDRFRREAMTLGRLQHPHIVQVFEVGECKGRPYYTMEYCPGGSLADYLRGSLLAPVEAATLLETLARATHAAHQAQVVHRDLKPGNVLLSGEPAAFTAGSRHPAANAAGSLATPKLADFGLARKLDASAQTQTGAVVGTPSYMAPEQARGESKSVGPAADIHALGAILYECLTGRPPFLGQTPLDTLLQVGANEPVPPRRLQPKVPRDLETICLKCLQKEPGHRFASALELAEDLHRFLNGEPIRARPVGPLERGWRWCRRNPVVAGLLTAVLLLVVAGGTGAWQYRQQRAATRARQRESDQQVQLALKHARTLLEEGWQENDEGKLASAQAEAETAAKVALSGGASETAREEADGLRAEIRGRQDQAARNNALLVALLDVTTPREPKQFVKDWTGLETTLEEASREEQFTSAFHRWQSDLDFDRMSIEEVVTRIQDQPPPVVHEIVAGLDAWMRERQRQRSPRADWQRLLQVIDRLDPSDRGRELRGILAGDQLRRERIVVELSRFLLPYSAWREPIRGEQRHRLRELADTVDPKREPVLGVVALARALDEGGFGPQAAGLLFAALAARPNQVVLLKATGELLQGQGRLAAAIECYRAARAMRPQLGVALAWALEDAERAEEGEAILHDLAQKHPDQADISYYLGVALGNQKKWAAAEKAFRRTVALRADYARAHDSLGVALIEQKKQAAGEEACRQAIKLRPGSSKAFYDLGLALLNQAKNPDAAAAFRSATKFRSDWAEAHYNHALALIRQLDPANQAEAEIALRRAIEARPDWARPYNNLGVVLQNQRRLPEAVAAVRRAVELAPDNRLYRNHLRHGLEPMLKADQYLTAVLKKEEPSPQDAPRQLSLAYAAAHRELYTVALPYFRSAFAADPRLASNLAMNHRYSAARAAVQGGCGQGKDAAASDDETRAGWRKEALNWLQADLQQWSRHAAGRVPEQRALAQRTLQRWRTHRELALVRDPKALAKLPEMERKEWQRFWAEVAAVFEQMPAQKPPR